MSEQEVFRAALDKWGAEHQTMKLFGEIAELEEAICKHLDGRDTTEHVAEEIADVQIMLEQMTVLHGCEEAVKEYRRSKVECLKIRIRFGGY